VTGAGSIGPAMTTDPVDPLRHAELTYLLGMAFQVLHTEFVERVAAAGGGDVRPVHAMLFQMLRSGGATSTELANQLGITKQATGQILDQLEARGYVVRSAHPEGGRRRLVQLTAAADAYLQMAGGVLHALEAEVAADLGEAELAEMRAELARLIRRSVGTAIPPLRPLW
jgi:DNA-binding MarR family transcriptional regulator